MSSHYCFVRLLCSRCRTQCLPFKDSYEVSVRSFFLFKSLCTAAHPSRPLFPICHHPQTCRESIPLSQQVFFSIATWVKCSLNLCPFLWWNLHCIMSPILSCSFLKTAVNHCHDSHYSHREDVQLISRQELYSISSHGQLVPFQGFQCILSGCCLLLQEGVNLLSDLYHTYPGGDVEDTCRGLTRTIHHEISADGCIGPRMSATWWG